MALNPTETFSRGTASHEFPRKPVAKLVAKPIDEPTSTNGISPISEEERRAIAAKTARWLFEIDAINFSGAPYFTLTSGKKSPVYVDCRKIISYPRFAEYVTESACRLLAHKDFDVIAGGETGGIAFAAWLAARLDKPMIYVRKRAKGFGLGSRIEGVLDAALSGTDAALSGTEGNSRKPRVLLVEDHATDGATKISFIEALRPFSTIEDSFVVFYYDIFTAGAAALRGKNISLHALTTWRDAYKLAEQRGDFAEDVLVEVSAFLSDPLRWQASHL